MAIFLLHGTEILAFMGSVLLGGIILMGILVAIAVKPQNYRHISIGYFVTATAISIVSISGYVESVLSIFLVSGVSFPGNLLGIFLEILGDQNGMGILLPFLAIVFNAALYYQFGKIILKHQNKSQ